MNYVSGNRGSRRLRVSGFLTSTSRGPCIQTEAGDVWVLDQKDVDPDMLGQRVTAEGRQAGYDRLAVDWLGEAST